MTQIIEVLWYWVYRKFCCWRILGFEERYIFCTWNVVFVLYRT